MIAAVTGAAVLLVPGEGRATEPPQLTNVHGCLGVSGFTCATLRVPLDHGGRVRGRLDLAVAVADTPQVPRRGFLLVVAPAQPGVPFAAQLAGKLAPVLRDYRLVLYDERGTGAGALQCPKLQAQIGRSPLLGPSTAEIVRSCAAAIGGRREFYGTDDVVRDMELLRRALRAERWTLDGISYGTYVAERYALAHPGRVRRLVLDSVVPHDESGMVLVPAMRRTATVLRLACRVAPKCQSDPAADLAAVVRARHNGTQLLHALVNLGLVDWSYRTPFDVPRLLHQARLGNSDGLNAMLMARPGGDMSADELSQGLLASKLCADLRWPWGNSSTPLAGRTQALRRAVKRLPLRALRPFDRATALGNGIVRTCLLWPPSPATPPPAPRARLPNIPVLLLAGDRDLITPIELARREATAAPRATLVVVAGAGHSVQFRAVSDAGKRAINRFLLAP
jgi:pimeloyl-ACP methyl ester carboxylesterase